MIFFPCPACAIRIPAASQHVGRVVPCPKCDRHVEVPDPDSYEEPGQDTVPNEREERRAPSAELIIANRTASQPKTNWLVVGCLIVAMAVALWAFLRPS